MDSVTLTQPSDNTFLNINLSSTFHINQTARRVHSLLKKMHPGDIHPRQATIARILNIGLRTVERCIALLKRMGIIKSKRTYLAASGVWLNNYTICINDIPYPHQLELMDEASYPQENEQVAGGVAGSYICIDNKRVKIKKKMISPQKITADVELTEEHRTFCAHNGLDEWQERQKFISHNQRHEKKHFNPGKALFGWLKNSVMFRQHRKDVTKITPHKRQVAPKYVQPAFFSVPEKKTVSTLSPVDLIKRRIEVFRASKQFGKVRALERELILLQAIPEP